MRSDSTYPAYGRTPQALTEPRKSSLERRGATSQATGCQQPIRVGAIRGASRPSTRNSHGPARGPLTSSRDAGGVYQTLTVRRL
jgi:hypothetical protein